MNWRDWERGRRWNPRIPLEHAEHLPLDCRAPPWAECQGPDDPCCGRCRFSTHGCNDDGPSRAAFLAYKRSPR